jgi:hypothetical protein
VRRVEGVRRFHGRVPSRLNEWAFLNGGNLQGKEIKESNHVALFRSIPRRSYLPRGGRLRANSNAILIIQLAASAVNPVDIHLVDIQPTATFVPNFGEGLLGGEIVPMPGHLSYIIHMSDEMKVRYNPQRVMEFASPTASILETDNSYQTTHSQRVYVIFLPRRDVQTHVGGQPYVA